MAMAAAQLSLFFIMDLKKKVKLLILALGILKLSLGSYSWILFVGNSQERNTRIKVKVLNKGC